MNVLHLAAECAPVAKVGGLADVVGALPSALAERGVDSAVLMPLYGGPHGAVAERAGALTVVSAGEVAYGPDRYPYAVSRADHAGAPLYLLHEPVHFGPDAVYAGPGGTPLPHADTRFLVFQLAALDWLVRGDGAPEADVLHLHDHHTGLIPALLAHGPDYAALSGVPTVFTVHSADHQGELPWAVWDRLGVHVPEPEGLLVEDEVNSMKAALHWADAVTTVSPTYADELTSDRDMANGLIEAFRTARPKLTGIVNGVDTGVWSPEADPHLPATYTAADLSGKAVTKRKVCAELSLDASRPLLTFVGRLRPEKGAELLPEAIERVLRHTEAAVAVLGSGDAEHEEAMKGLIAMLASEGKADRLAAVLAFDNALAHQLYAAGDLFLMPSKSEPCGLGQLYAMAYGTPPVVHAVGGLRDTVAPFDAASGAGTGFAFDAFTVAAFFEAIQAGLAVVADPEAYARLQQNGMAADHSWGRSAEAYAALYERLVPASVG
ncbi:MAG: glycogen/starch synthase [Bacteroidota bacterium]